MKAAILHEVNAPFSIEDVVIAKPKRREVLIRTAFAGLCHSDLHFIEGLYPAVLPCVPGHESAGIVEAVGEDVTYVKPGDHVREARRPRGHLPVGVLRRMTWKGAALKQMFKLSSFAKQLLVHEHAIVKIDPEMPLDRASLVGCALG